MDWALFPRGLLIGLSVAAPVGPMALLCMRRTLASGFVAGFVSGAGIASADAVYGAIAAFGLTALSSFLVERQDLVRSGGGIFLCYLGWRTFRTAPTGSGPSGATDLNRHLGAYMSTFALTLTNPATILSFAAIFSGFGAVQEGAGSAPATALILGVFCGSVLWWLMLVTAIGRLRGRLTVGRLTGINRVCGIAFVVFGLLALSSAIR